LQLKQDKMKNFKILNQIENPLFKRKETTFSVDSEITPSNIDTKKFISENFSIPAENIKIRKILGKFGSKTFTVYCNLYESKEDKEKVEIKTKKEIAEEKKVEESSTPEPKEEIIEQTPESQEVEEVLEKTPEENTIVKEEINENPEKSIQEGKKE